MGVFRILPTNIAGFYYISMKLRRKQHVPCSVCACEPTDRDACFCTTFILRYLCGSVQDLATDSVLLVQAAHRHRLNGMLASEDSPILMQVIMLQWS